MDEFAIPLISSNILYQQILINNVADEGEIFYNISEVTNYIENKTTPDFSTIADTDEGMFATADDFGTSYYFRGATEDNYVEFADMLWRIVRIDGEGNIKLMLYNENTEGTSYLGINNDARVAFNSVQTNLAYSGYMYQASTQYGNTTNSNAKTTLETWYAANLLSNYDDYISKTAINCTDRTMYTQGGSSGAYTYTLASTLSLTTTRYYGAYKRIMEGSPVSYNPSLVCPMAADAFSAEETDKGNGKLTYPVAMITIDEASFAGGVRSLANSEYYLCTGFNYWTISPAYWLYISTTNLAARVFAVYQPGNFFEAGNSPYLYRLLPAVSLTSEIEYEAGDGTRENPYKVKTNI